MKSTFVNLPDADEFFAKLEAELHPDKTNHPMFELLEANPPLKKIALRTIVDCKIVQEDKDNYSVAIAGIKFDAHLPKKEALTGSAVGKTVTVAVIGVPSEPEHPLIVSERYAIDWSNLQESEADNSTVEVLIDRTVVRRDRVQGLRASFGCVACFIPASQIPYHMKADTLVGQTIAVNVLPFGRRVEEGGLPILSLRKALDGRKEDLIRHSAVGELVKGVVREFVTSAKSNQQIGALVELSDSGLTEFLHWSEITDRYAKPEATLSLGQEIELSVVSIDPKEKSLSLSYKRAQRNSVLEAISEGDRLQVKVLRFKQRIGYFVLVDGKFTALLPCSEISNKRLREGVLPYQAGDMIDVVVKSKDDDGQKLIVSHKTAVLAGLVEGNAYDGKVTGVLAEIGLLVSVDAQEGLLHKSEFCKRDSMSAFKVGDPLLVIFKEKRTVKGEERISWSRADLNS